MKGFIKLQTCVS